MNFNKWLINLKKADGYIETEEGLEISRRIKQKAMNEFHLNRSKLTNTYRMYS